MLKLRYSKIHTCGYYKLLSLSDFSSIRQSTKAIYDTGDRKNKYLLR